MELPLANPAGVWLGKHSGRYVDSRYRLRGQPVRFPMMGKYHFAIAHGMRDEAVKDIAHVGFLVEYSNAK
jgi:gliding motility-associated lipoprotein GldH